MRRRNLLTLACVALVAPGARAEEMKLSAAIGLLGRERSFAESEAGLLKRYGPQDEIEGQRLYALARADFDALIEALLTDLAEHRDPSASPEFQSDLKEAVTARLAFTRHVDAALSAAVPKGAKPGFLGDMAEALAKGVPDLVKALVDGGISIWREWRGASKERRDDIKNRIEDVRWKPFADIAPAV